jgi:hypothetical protein
MRRLLVVIAAAAFLPAALARPDAETYAPKDGGYSVKFPGKPMELTQKPKTGAGDLDVKMAVYATSKGEAFVTAYNEVPGGKLADDKMKEFLAGVVNGVKGDGMVIKSQDFEFGDGKLPAKSFTIEKSKQQFVRGLVVVGEGRVYQVLVVGPKAFVEGREARTFLDSFKLTK